MEMTNEDLDILDKDAQREYLLKRTLEYYNRVWGHLRLPYEGYNIEDYYIITVACVGNREYSYAELLLNDNNLVLCGPDFIRWDDISKDPSILLFSLPEFLYNETNVGVWLEHRKPYVRELDLKYQHGELF